MIYSKDNSLFFSSHDNGDLVAWSIENNLSEVARINISKGSINIITQYKNFLLTGDTLGEFRIFNINANFKNEFTFSVGHVSYILIYINIYSLYMTSSLLKTVSTRTCSASLSQMEKYMYMMKDLINFSQYFLVFQILECI
jgi:hypothetical protein